MSNETDQAHTQTSTELIMYQLGEVKGLLQTMSNKLEQYKSDTDKRLIDLEKFQAAQIVQDAKQPRLDPQKIILTLIAFASSVAALSLGYNTFHR